MKRFIKWAGNNFLNIISYWLLLSAAIFAISIYFPNDNLITDGDIKTLACALIGGLLLIGFFLIRLFDKILKIEEKLNSGKPPLVEKENKK